MSKKQSHENHSSRASHTDHLVEDGKEKLVHAYEEGREKIGEMYNNTKEKAHDLYEEGVKKVCEVQDQVHDQVKAYADNVVKTVHEKPLTSLLIAGGIGFIIASLLNKK